MKFLISTLIILFSSFATAECPVDNNDTTAVQDAINNATSCYEAAQTASNCAVGSNLDNMFAGAAIEICGQDFADITPIERASYDGLVSQCAKKYEAQIGSLYVSARAFCVLGVAQTFSSVFSAIE